MANVVSGLSKLFARPSFFGYRGAQLLHRSCSNKQQPWLYRGAGSPGSRFSQTRKPEHGCLSSESESPPRRRRRRSLFVFIDTVEGPRAPAVKLTAHHSSLTRVRAAQAALFFFCRGPLRIRINFWEDKKSLDFRVPCCRRNRGVSGTSFVSLHVKIGPFGEK